MKSLCRRHFFRLVSLWHFAHFMGGGHTFRPKLRVVSCCSIRNPSRTLEAQLRRAQALTPELISDVTAEACVCFAARGGTAKQRINRLIDAGAWTDTALALLELGAAAMEASQDRLRRRRMALELLGRGFDIAVLLCELRHSGPTDNMPMPCAVHHPRGDYRCATALLAP